MKEIYGRILAGLSLGTIAVTCFMNSFLTACMITGIMRAGKNSNSRTFVDRVP